MSFTKQCLLHSHVSLPKNCPFVPASIGRFAVIKSTSTPPPVWLPWRVAITSSEWSTWQSCRSMWLLSLVYCCVCVGVCVVGVCVCVCLVGAWAGVCIVGVCVFGALLVLLLCFIFVIDQCCCCCRQLLMY